MSLIDVFKGKLGCSQVAMGQEGSSALNEIQHYKTDKGSFFVKLHRSSRLQMLEAEAKGLKSIPGPILG